MAEMQIRSFSIADPMLESFRLRVLTEDLDIDPKAVDAICDYAQVHKLFRNHSEVEEVYKFSRNKWESVNFDSVYGLVDSGEIVSIAGIRLYANQFLRMGMHYYTLKNFRRAHRSILWRSGGFIDSALVEFPLINHFFISIYPHNDKLRSWVRRLQNGNRYSQLANSESGVLNRLKSLHVSSRVKLNGVDQVILHFSKDGKRLPDNFEHLLITSSKTMEINGIYL